MPHVSDFKIDGLKWPSVNEITDSLSKEGLVRWWRKLGFEAADKISKESRERGTSIHATFEAVLKNEEYLIPDEHKAFVESLLAWQTENNYQFLEIEPHIKSTLYGYHGSPDFVGTVIGSDVIEMGDFKIKDRESDYKIMMNEAAYCQAYKEERGTKPEVFRILTLHPKTAKMHDMCWKNEEIFFFDFLRCFEMREVNKKANAWFRKYCNSRLV